MFRILSLAAFVLTGCALIPRGPTWLVACEWGEQHIEIDDYQGGLEEAVRATCLGGQAGTIQLTHVVGRILYGTYSAEGSDPASAGSWRAFRADGNGAVSPRDPGSTWGYQPPPAAGSAPQRQKVYNAD